MGLISGFRNTEAAGFKAAGELLASDNLTDAQFIELLCKECRQFVRSAQLSQDLARADKAHFMHAWKQITDALNRLGLLLESGQKYAKAHTAKEQEDLEFVALHNLIESRLTYYIPAFKERNQHVRRKFRPFEFQVERKLLTELIDTCIEWAIESGHELEFRLATAEKPTRAKLVIKAIVMDPEAKPSSPNNLSWHVLKRLAEVLKVKVDSIFGEKENILSLSFTPIEKVSTEEGLSIFQAETSREHTLEMSWEEASQIKGKNVLVVCDDPSHRLEVSGLLRHAKFNVFSAHDVAQAISMLSLNDIDAVVITKSLSEGEFAPIRKQLREINPRYPIIVLTSNEYSFYISSPFSDAPATVGINEVERQLVPALLLEMTKALRP